MEPKRARRIRDKLRMKAKALRVNRSIKQADNLAVCSCHMCRNPRHSHFHSGLDKLTMQERKHIEGWGGLGNA